MSRKLLSLSMWSAIASIVVSQTDAQTLTTLYNFKGGTDGGGTVGSLTYQNGFLFGANGSFSSNCSCYGTVFKVDASSGSETVLHDFALSGGCASYGSLIFHGTSLIGTTSLCGNGTVFRINPKTQAFNTIYSFTGGADGWGPDDGLILEGGAFYGTTEIGGSRKCDPDLGCGVVFKIDAKTGVESTVYTFNGGMTDGAYPEAALIYDSGNFYGTTYGGGPAGVGAVFKINAATGSESVLYFFTGGSDGGGPAAPLISHRGNLYGTTVYGGANHAYYCTTGLTGCGTVFMVNQSTGAETALHSFTSQSDGAYPSSGLIYQGGNLYGSTIGGYGGSVTGTIYKINPSTGTETVLHSFTGADGASPQGQMIYNSNVFYGTTSSGGSGGYGTVFKFTP
jgi:uncharacterized repeat protein (TIGR03803 family)